MQGGIKKWAENHVMNPREYKDLTQGFQTASVKKIQKKGILLSVLSSINLFLPPSSFIFHCNFSFPAPCSSILKSVSFKEVVVIYWEVFGKKRIQLQEDNEEI